jgi:hypothetical protein
MQQIFPKREICSGIIGFKLPNSKLHCGGDEPLHQESKVHSSAVEQAGLMHLTR